MTAKDQQKMKQALDARGRYVHQEPDGSWYEVSKCQQGGGYGSEYSLWNYQPVGTSGVVESNCVVCSWRLQDIIDCL